MLGSEGRLGHWDMPEAEPDMDQKNQNNLRTLDNSITLMRGLREFHQQYPDSKIRLNKGDMSVIASKQREKVWIGMGGGALTELAEAGLGEMAEEIINPKTVFEGDESAK